MKTDGKFRAQIVSHPDLPEYRIIQIMLTPELIADAGGQDLQHGDRVIATVRGEERRGDVLGDPPNQRIWIPFLVEEGITLSDLENFTFRRVN